MASSQTFAPHRYEIQQDGLYGLMDGEGWFVVPPAYAYLGDFCEGRAAVLSNGKVGYLDADGPLVIPPGLRGGQPFSDGLALVVTEDGWGYIDQAGEFVIVPQFSLYVFPFRGALALVQTQGSYYLMLRRHLSVCLYPRFSSGRLVSWTSLCSTCTPIT